ncbi:MAG: carboxylesterase/lipase family protein [Rhodospirillaceae bacterium]|nr:carboxylesterase/lipase family protein [Rhodospirillaceae bacterium]
MAGAVVTTQLGKLEGAVAGGVATFRGVPYAAAPVGKQRFAPPAPHEGWSGTRDATKDGPAAPQLGSRLERVMGRVDFAQGEDCLSLTIMAPAPVAAGAKRPVMVWFHGGAWMSGAGSLSLYSGASLARSGVVFVGVNYRLGVLGYLSVPELEGSGTGANFGLLDHVAALRWVRDNIAAFGGDPANVTLFGQSAGGGSIASLMEMAEAAPLFRRAILQSAAIMPPTSAEGAHATCDAVLKAAGLDRGRIGALRDLPVDKILEAQRGAVMTLGNPLDPTPPYRMVKDGAAVQYDPPAGIAAGISAGKEIMIGTTRDEVHAFFVNNEALAKIDKPAMVAALRGTSRITAPAHTEAIVEAYAKRLPGVSPQELFAAVRTDGIFRLPSLRFAEAQTRQRGTAYLYRFDWVPTADAPYGAAHCIELPFMFDNLPDWDAAPLPPAMLAGGDRPAMQRLAASMRQAWVAFATSGNPNHAGLPDWKPYTADARHSLIFDAENRAATNLDDEMEAVWRG